MINYKKVYKKIYTLQQQYNSLMSERSSLVAEIEEYNLSLNTLNLQKRKLNRDKSKQEELSSINHQIDDLREKKSKAADSLVVVNERLDGDVGSIYQKFNLLIENLQFSIENEKDTLQQSYHPSSVKYQIDQLITLKESIKNIDFSTKVSEQDFNKTFDVVLTTMNKIDSSLPVKESEKKEISSIPKTSESTVPPKAQPELKTPNQTQVTSYKAKRAKEALASISAKAKANAKQQDQADNQKEAKTESQKISDPEIPKSPLTEQSNIENTTESDSPNSKTVSKSDNNKIIKKPNKLKSKLMRVSIGVLAFLGVLGTAINYVKNHTSNTQTKQQTESVDPNILDLSNETLDNVIDSTETNHINSSSEKETNIPNTYQDPEYYYNYYSNQAQFYYDESSKLAEEAEVEKKKGNTEKVAELIKKSEEARQIGNENSENAAYYKNILNNLGTTKQNDEKLTADSSSDISTNNQTNLDESSNSSSFKDTIKVEDMPIIQPQAELGSIFTIPRGTTVYGDSEENQSKGIWSTKSEKPLQICACAAVNNTTGCYEPNSRHITINEMKKMYSKDDYTYMVLLGLPGSEYEDRNSWVGWVELDSIQAQKTTWQDPKSADITEQDVEDSLSF